MKNILYTIILCFLFSFSVFADSELSIKEIEILAEQGEPWAQSALRLEKTEILAEQGDADAQYMLGELYYIGTEIYPHQDYKEAAKWYRLSAEQGNAEAQYNLAVMYLEGKGVKKDAKEAIKFFELASKQGHKDAPFYLGLYYYNDYPQIFFPDATG